MGKKMFINNTGHDLSVQLQVRRGDTPGHLKGFKDFYMSKGQREMVEYSGPDNPYLDGISVNAIDSGEIVAEQQFVINRGSSLDNDFNTNDTVTFNWETENITLAFSNTWTV